MVVGLMVPRVKLDLTPFRSLRQLRGMGNLGLAFLWLLTQPVATIVTK